MIVSLLETLIVIGLLIFTKGFLPPTLFKPGFSTLPTNVPPKFDKLVFIVIDAMRSDFMFSNQSSMTNVHELLNQGFGYAYTAFSDPPTVTLPRLKGLTTGATPNFLDAVVNIAEADTASTLNNQDSWIHQFQARGSNMHFYGDDTWLKLFPNHFKKYDGTSSFFVSDYTEVDYNVTRHLDYELANQQNWDLLILHYLGLDHIGHKSGARSPLLPLKEKEMDEIIKKVYDKLDANSLLVVVGDHGMNEVGNHGGASKPETSAAMLMLSKQFSNPMEAPQPENPDYEYFSRVKQVDLVPTLSYLMGLPIPLNSLGVIIPDFLNLWSSEEQSLIRGGGCSHLGLPKNCGFSELQQRQEKLMRSSTEYVFSLMYSGLAIISLGVLTLLYLLVSTNPRWSAYSFIWAGLCGLYFIGMLGSSTVEEEHYIWYFVLTSVLLLQLVFYSKNWRTKLQILEFLLGLRILRGWNSVGQKWVGIPGFSQFLESQNNKSVLKYLLYATTLYFILNSRTKILSVLTYSLVLYYKLKAVTTPICDPLMLTLAKVIFGLSIIESVWSKQAPFGIYLLETKLTNIPLWPVMTSMRQVLNSMNINLELYSFICLCMEFTTFFASGGGNSLATVDLSNAYNGISGYNIPLVALLTYLGNWSFSLYWVPYASLCQQQNNNHQRKKHNKAPLFRALFYSIMCLSVCFACLILREHLFIWTVFAPKILYVIAWLSLHELLATKTGAFIRRFVSYK